MLKNDDKDFYWICLALASLVILLFLFGCTTARKEPPPPPGPTAEEARGLICDAMSAAGFPIALSRSDTDETKRQVTGANNSFACTCLDLEDPKRAGLACGTALPTPSLRPSS